MQDVGKINGKSKRDILTDVYLEMIEDQGDISGIETGFSLLNSMLNGFQKGDLIIIAARPSVGKTALSLNLASNCCKSGFSGWSYYKRVKTNCQAIRSTNCPVVPVV